MKSGLTRFFIFCALIFFSAVLTLLLDFSFLYLCGWDITCLPPLELLSVSQFGLCFLVSLAISMVVTCKVTGWLQDKGWL